MDPDSAKSTGERRSRKRKLRDPASSIVEELFAQFLKKASDSDLESLSSAQKLIRRQLSKYCSYESLQVNIEHWTKFHYEIEKGLRDDDIRRIFRFA